MAAPTHTAASLWLSRHTIQARYTKKALIAAPMRKPNWMVRRCYGALADMGSPHTRRCLETLTLLARQPISGQTGDPRSEDATDGQAAAARRPVEDHRAPAPGAAPAGPEGRPAAAPAPAGPDRHPVRAQDRPAVGGPASRDELRVRDVVLAQAAGLAGRRHLGEDPRRPARTTRPSRQAGLVEVRHRQLQRPRGVWGADTGPTPPGSGRPRSLGGRSAPSCSTDSTEPASWTGRSAPSTAPASARFLGGRYRPEPDRPREGRQQAPPDGGPRRRPAGLPGERGERPRRGHAVGHRGRLSAARVRRSGAPE